MAPRSTRTRAVVSFPKLIPLYKILLRDNNDSDVSSTFHFSLISVQVEDEQHRNDDGSRDGEGWKTSLVSFWVDTKTFPVFSSKISIPISWMPYFYLAALNEFRTMLFDC
ncbi:hypothetical protein ACA910_019930 [Epithemia clementina (nom. ined.)]